MSPSDQPAYMYVFAKDFFRGHIDGEDMCQDTLARQCSDMIDFRDGNKRTT